MVATSSSLPAYKCYNSKKARLVYFITFTTYFNIENLHFCMFLAEFTFLIPFRFGIVKVRESEYCHKVKF